MRPKKSKKNLQNKNSFASSNMLALIMPMIEPNICEA